MNYNRKRYNNEVSSVSLHLTYLFTLHKLYHTSHVVILSIGGAFHSHCMYNRAPSVCLANLHVLSALAHGLGICLLIILVPIDLKSIELPNVTSSTF
jgi:hypothetical protein